MKKPVFAIVCLLLLCALAVPAAADVIWEPDDDFYYDHWDECVYSDSFYTAAEDTTIWDSPQNRQPIGTVPAETTVETPYLWTDARGDKWGYVELRRNGSWVSGWINTTDPEAGPLQAFQPLPVLIASGVIAVGVIAILLVPVRKKKD